MVLFIPGEQFLGAALDVDRGLFEDALRQKIILATPANFVALLRTVAYGWRQEALAENAQEIRDVGEELYARLSVFSEHLTKLGKSLGMAVGDYNKAIGSYETKLLPGARKFADMGWVATARSNHRSRWTRHCAISSRAEPPGTCVGAIF